MIINYSILLTFDGISHVSAFDLEAMCAWHMKHILQIWFITQLLFFFLFVSGEAAPRGQHGDSDSHPCRRGMTVTLDGGSEKSEYVLISQFGRSFCLFSKAQNDSQRSLLFLKTFFFFLVGKDEQGITGYGNLFSKLGGGFRGKKFYNPRVVWEAADLEGLWCNMTGWAERLRADGGFFSWMGVGLKGWNIKTVPDSSVSWYIFLPLGLCLLVNRAATEPVHSYQCLFIISSDGCSQNNCVGT